MRNVKRFVFILLVVALLLTAEMVTIWATRADTPLRPIKADSLDFYFKTDENARYLDLKSKWQAETRGEITFQKASELAEEAYTASSVESPLKLWRAQGGPAPNIFHSKIHICNTGKEALLNVPMTATLRARVGELRVKPDIQMTDYDHLERSSKWVSLGQSTVNVPAFAPGEDMLLEMNRFKLMEFLSKHSGRWPVEVEVKVSSPQMGTIRKTMALIPDHFVVPILY